MRFERRARVPLGMAVAAPIGAVVTALAIAGIAIAAAGVNVLDAYREIAIGAFGSRLSVTETLTRASPLILTGLAAAVAFRARIWNIGGEGQFYLGAISAAAVAWAIPAVLPGTVKIPIILLGSGVAGALLLLLPLLLRLRFAVDEVVTTLLLNFVVILFVSILIEGPLRDPLAFGWPQSVAVDAGSMLPKLVPRTRLHLGLVIAVAMALLVWFIEARTAFGTESRAAGINPAATVFAGVSLPRTLIKVALISGGLAGLAGGIEVLGLKGYVTTDLSPGYGYAGIVVAMLAGLNPIGVVFAAAFVAMIFIGADGMSRALAVPSFIADVTVSLSLLTMLVALFLVSYRVRR